MKPPIKPHQEQIHHIFWNAAKDAEYDYWHNIVPKFESQLYYLTHESKKDTLGMIKVMHPTFNDAQVEEHFKKHFEKPLETKIIRLKNTHECQTLHIRKFDEYNNHRLSIYKHRLISLGSSSAEDYRAKQIQND